MPHSFRQRRAAHGVSLVIVAIVLSCGGLGFTSLLTGMRTPPPPKSLRLSSSSPQPNVAPRRASETASEGPIAVKKGDRVQVFYENVWYDCEVLEVSEGGKACTVRYDDGGDEEGDVDVAERVRAMPPPMKLEKGQKVEVSFEGQWYDCEILAVSEDGETCTAKYDEGGDEEPDIEVRQRVREPRMKFADLEVGQKFTGKVISIAPFGAFVDIGAERDGLVHISRIADARVEDIYDYVSEGQEVDVWVSQVSEDGKLGLTMVEGRIAVPRRGPQDFSPFTDVPSDQWLTGTVARIAPFGLFVSVTPPEGGDAADGLVHITQIRDGFVENTEDEAEVGQEIQVRVTNVDLDQGRMSLSMKEPGSFGGGAGRAPADLTPFEDVGPEEWLSGKVARVAPFGAFVTVTAPDGEATADGLVHITQIRDGFVESVEDEVEPGQDVKVRVQSVDTQGGKMSLSMKEPEAY